MEDKTVELLVRSLDQKLTKAEQKELDIALKSSSELRQIKEQFIEMRQLLCKQKQNFKDGFTENVMGKIGETDFSEEVIPMFRKVAYTAAACIVILLAFNIYSGGNLSMDSLVGVQPVAEDLLTFNVMGY